MAAVATFEHPMQPQAAPHPVAAIFLAAYVDLLHMPDHLGQLVTFGRRERSDVGGLPLTFPAEGWRALIGPRPARSMAFTVADAGFRPVPSLHLPWLTASRLACEVSARHNQLGEQSRLSDDVC